MQNFPIAIPILIRYGDLDPQRHVNNSRFLTYMEQARMQYLIDAGLWDGKDFLDLGLIVADAHIAFLAPIALRQRIQVGARIARIGNKSLLMEYRIEDETTGACLATGETVMVAYDYHTLSSIPVPEDWRRKIREFDHAA